MEVKTYVTYDVVVYKHENGKWIPKYTVTEADLEEMRESSFVRTLRTFTFDEWRRLRAYAEEHGQSLAEILDEGREGQILHRGG